MPVPQWALCAGGMSALTYARMYVRAHGGRRAFGETRGGLEAPE